MNVGLGWASLIGAAGGTLSTLGYQYIQPFLERKIGLHDTCGVHNLHGMPGVFGGIVSVIAIALMEGDDSYPSADKSFHHSSFGMQAGYQVAGIVVTLAMAV